MRRKCGSFSVDLHQVHFRGAVPSCRRSQRQSGRSIRIDLHVRRTLSVRVSDAAIRETKGIGSHRDHVYGRVVRAFDVAHVHFERDFLEARFPERNAEVPIV